MGLNQGGQWVHEGEKMLKQYKIRHYNFKLMFYVIALAVIGIVLNVAVLIIMAGGF